MKHDSRRLIAFVAAKLMGNTEARSVYDISLNATTGFSGHLSSDGIFLFDLSTKQRVVGHGTPDSLTLAYGMDQITLSMSAMDKTFQGIDLESQVPFSGSVLGRSITLFDESERKHFVYEV